MADKNDNNFYGTNYNYYENTNELHEGGDRLQTNPHRQGLPPTVFATAPNFLPSAQHQHNGLVIPINYQNANLGIPPVHNLMPGSFGGLSIQNMRQGIPNRPPENEVLMQMPYNAGALFGGTPSLSNQVQGDYTPVHQMSALEQARAQQQRQQQQGMEPMQMSYQNTSQAAPSACNLMPGSFEGLSLQNMRQGIPNRPAQNEVLMQMPYNAGALYRGTPPLSNQVQGDYTPVHQMGALEQARAQQRRLQQHGLEPMQMSYQIVNQGTAPAPRIALRNEEPVGRRPALLALPQVQKNANAEDHSSSSDESHSEMLEKEEAKIAKSTIVRKKINKDISKLADLLDDEDLAPKPVSKKSRKTKESNVEEQDSEDADNPQPSTSARNKRKATGAAHKKATARKTKAARKQEDEDTDESDGEKSQRKNIKKGRKDSDDDNDGPTSIKFYVPSDRRNKK